MIVYLINKDTKEIINKYENVIYFSEEYVLINSGEGNYAKLYCCSNEQYIDTI